MIKFQTFRFLDDGLNRRLIALLRKTKIRHTVGRDGTISFHPEDEEAFENDAVCSIRDEILPGWQILTCPRNWVARYRKYMDRNAIPFHEESSDGETWFLLSRKFRPERWKLETRKRVERVAS
jgi:hypothetical protein